VEAEGGQVEWRLCSGVSYAFASGLVTGSPKAGPGEGALFVLCPAVVVAVVVAVAVVVVAADADAEGIVDLKAKCFAEAGHSEC
jgi:hypothetical protein